MPESRAVIVLEISADQIKYALSILGVVRLPEPYKIYAAVQDSADRILDVFIPPPPDGADAKVVKLNA